MSDSVFFCLRFPLLVELDLLEASLHHKNKDRHQDSWTQNAHNHDHPHLERVESAAGRLVVVSIKNSWDSIVTAISTVVGQYSHTVVVVVSDRLAIGRVTRHFYYYINANCRK